MWPNPPANDLPGRNEFMRVSTELDQLFAQISEQEYELHQNEKTLMQVRKFFDRGELWPDQCDFAVRVLNNVGIPLRKLNKLLDVYLARTNESGLNRYEVLAQGHYLDKEIHELQSRIQRYRQACRSREKTTNGESQKIAFQLDQAWKHYQSLKEILEIILTQSKTGISTC